MAAYKTYFEELNNLYNKLATSQRMNNKDNLDSFLDIHEQLDIDQKALTSSVNLLLKGLVPAKKLNDELPLLVKECIEECKTPMTLSKATKVEISNQIEHYSTSFTRLKDEMLSIIVKKDTFEYERSQQSEFGYKDEKLKFLSAFRIYRRTIAPKVKAEKPNLTGKERQAIIRDQWKKLDAKKKYVYVLRSRWDKEKARFRQRTMEIKAQLALFSEQEENSGSSKEQADKEFADGKQLDIHLLFIY